MPATVPVKRSESIMNELNAVRDRIMKRAFEIFDGNGHAFGHDLDHWLEAEREIVWKPAIEVEEKDGKLCIQVAVPGVDPKDMDVNVTAEDVLVKAHTQHEHREEKGKVHICEFKSGNLFRSVRLPKKIDPDKVKAEFKNGLLTLTAEIAQESAPRKVEVIGS